MLKVSKRVIKKADLDGLSDDIKEAEEQLITIVGEVTSLESKITELETAMNEYPSEINAAFTRFSSSMEFVIAGINKINKRL